MEPHIWIVSNRLPISIDVSGEEVQIRPSSGGLVSALAPILRASGGTWIGWDGGAAQDTPAYQEALDQFPNQAGFNLKTITLDAKDVEGFYNGFSNAIVWPLFHDLQTRCDFDPKSWGAYRRVNESYASRVVELSSPEDFIWVHDFHLMALGGMIREQRPNAWLGFFLHIPFPPPDIFFKLPWRAEVLRSFFAYNIIGLQTARDLKNFLDCLSVAGDVKTTQKGKLVQVTMGESASLVGAFPISIDSADLNLIAQSEGTKARAQEIRDKLGVDKLVLSVDRLDYTKGIPYRIKAFRVALERYPEYERRVALVQIVVPSRETVPEYQKLRSEIDETVTKVNGELGEPGWIPVHHFYRSISREELVAFYLAADVALVTPLKDGMNLVAKEYAALPHDERGILILSEFAGAAEELGRDSLLVNPYALEEVAAALKVAWELDPETRLRHCQALQEHIKGANIFRWASDFLRSAGWKSVLGFEEEEKDPTWWEKFRRLFSRSSEGEGRLPL